MKKTFVLLFALSLPCLAAPKPITRPAARPAAKPPLFPAPNPTVPPGMVQWKFQFPQATYMSCPHQVRKTTAPPWKPLAPLFVPHGTTNLALNRPVSSSDSEPVIGNLGMLTDGDKEGTEGHWVELAKGRQWVQIELPAVSQIYAVHLWHYFGKSRVYRDVVIQVSDDREFKTGVRTIYNNDQDNSSGLGKGKDREFYESREGFLLRLPTSGAHIVTGRFVRLYSNGQDAERSNHYIEVEVIGRPVSAIPPPKLPAKAALKPPPPPGLVEWKYRFPMPFAMSVPHMVRNTTAPRWTPLAPLFVPRGTTNLALNRPVSSSDSEPVIGNLGMLTDGTKDGTEGQWMELAPTPQWVQIELAEPSKIYALHLWRYFGEWRVYRDVVIQVSNDPAFKTGVRTIYNNDQDDTLGLGKGSDREYYESHQGFLLRLPQSGDNLVTGRYVRLYSNGNSADRCQHYTEVEVLGQPILLKPIPSPKAPPGFVQWQPQIPPATYGSGPPRWKVAPPNRVEKLPTLWVPRGAANLAWGKPVTSSDDAPLVGELAMITNGDKEGTDGHWVELGPGAQWVQIDLGQPSRIHGLHIWHYFGETVVCRDVIVQVADDPTFARGVRTLFNNDADNSAGQGKGKDTEYAERNLGFIVDANGTDFKGAYARYVRLYSSGYGWANPYIEVEVIGVPNPPLPSHQKPELVEWKFQLPDYGWWGSRPRMRINTTALPRQPLGKLYVPRGATNLSLNQPVTSSDSEPILGNLKMVTDGDKNSSDGHFMEIAPSRQWVQIELPAVSRIYAIHLWHYFDDLRVFRDVVIQVSNDRDFRSGVRTLFNNDHDNSSGLGVGPDREYYEGREGFLLRLPLYGPQVITARYVRLYSKGNSSDPVNQYVEVEVIGEPAQAKLSSKPALPPKASPTKAKPAAKTTPKRKPPSGYVKWQPQFPLASYNDSGPRKPANLQRPLPELPTLWVPRGATNIAKSKPVSSSDDAPIIGALVMITDGAKEESEGHWVQLGESTQWVQIDLGKLSRIFGVHIWHYFKEARVYRHVIVQVSNDPDFINGVRTLFNNDNDNSSGQGAGRDTEYYESRFGKLLDLTGADYTGVVARYVRLYSKGNTIDPANHYIEVEVIGQQ